jgi:CcmD family protein
MKSLTTSLWRAVAAGVSLGMPALAWAQEPQSQFVPADSLPQEVLPATPFVFAAYAFVWLALVAYVFLLWRRLGRVERELADVNAKLANRTS